MHRPASALEALLPTPWRHELSADELVEFVADNLGRNRIFESDETRKKRVPQVVVFVAHCAPRSATALGLRLAAEFLFVFFALNDQWEATHAVVKPASDPSESAGVRWIRRWRKRLPEEHGARAQRFLDAFELYLESLQQEQRYEREPGHPTFEEYVDVERGRYQWVATAPYIELWELSLGLDLDAWREQADPMKALAVELSYLANDIGSLGRDKPTKNYVRLLMEHDPSLATLESALESTSKIYADKARSLVDRRRAFPAESTLARYAELVCDIADGNLRATTLLARNSAEGRYSPLARECLSALPLVGSR